MITLANEDGSCRCYLLCILPAASLSMRSIWSVSSIKINRCSDTGATPAIKSLTDAHRTNASHAERKNKKHCQSGVSDVYSVITEVHILETCCILSYKRTILLSSWNFLYIIITLKFSSEHCQKRRRNVSSHSFFFFSPFILLPLLHPNDSLAPHVKSWR